MRELPTPPPTKFKNPWDRGDGPSSLPPDWKPNPKTPSGGKPEEMRKAWNDYNARKFNDFIKREYRAPGGAPGAKVPSFKGIMKSIRGFGGVFLGNEVVDTGLPAVKSIKWKADP